MDEQEQKRKMQFKDLLKKMYEKGESESDISTKKIIEDMESELREILAYK